MAPLDYLPPGQGARLHDPRRRTDQRPPILDGFVKAVYRPLAAGIDYMEIGYKDVEESLFPRQVGAWKFCDEDDQRRTSARIPRR